jgi:signal transduction histidine kinase
MHHAEEATGCLGEPARPELREQLTVLHTRAKSLITLAHNVNIFAQSLSAKAPLVETEFDPEVQIGIIMARVGAACAERGLAMRATVAPDCPRLFADELKVGFVLLNAISNAIRFTPVGGTLSFDVGLQADGWLAVSLSDNGLGMPPAVVERLRNCLEHPGEIAGIHGGPIGLGLPIGMSIARLHGGRLEIASSVGQGTTVSLLMPPERLRPTAARSNDGSASERRSA